MNAITERINKVVFIINGCGGNGKDLFIKYTQECSAKRIFNISSIDPVKKAFLTLIGEGYGSSELGDVDEFYKIKIDNINKNNKTRSLLHSIKDAWVTYNNGPFEYIIDKISKMPDESIVFVHVRESDEIKKLVNYYKKYETVFVTTLLVRGNNCPDEFTNDADCNVEDFQYDLFVKNYGTMEDLNSSAKELCDCLDTALDHWA